MMRIFSQFAVVVTLAVVIRSAWGGDVGCPKENIVQGGLDRSLPCIFQSPLSWAEHRVVFRRDSSALDSQAHAVLNRQAAVLQAYPNLPVTVWGHVDHEEAKRANGAALGFQRANAVRDYLILRGVAPERISTDSRGDRAMVITDRSDGALAIMRYATTETENNPRR